MTTDPTRDEGLAALRHAIQSYCELTDETWARLTEVVDIVSLPEDAFFCRLGQTPTAFGFVVRGLLRCYVSDVEGHEYNKVFFHEGTFPGTMVALLTGSPSRVALQALEPTTLMKIDFRGYRRVLEEREDLKWFQILYLEKNWLLAKEPREVALVQETATERYLRFQREHPGLEDRLPQYHVASHLGVTPTQLSRVRRELRKKGGPST